MHIIYGHVHAKAANTQHPGTLDCRSPISTIYKDFKIERLKNRQK
jgi:hypothetical protein